MKKGRRTPKHKSHKIREKINTVTVQKKLLPNFLIKIINILGINKALGFGIINRIWGVLAGPLTILLISIQFSKEEQGYYYTFFSLIGLQVFFELGLLNVIAQFASHEFAYLSWDKKGVITGSVSHLNRFIDLLGKAFKWYAICAVLLIASLIPAGLFFLQQPTNIDKTILHWQLPWILTVIGVGCNLLLIPFYGVITGSGDITSIQRRELIGGITGSLIGWSVIACGGGLFAIPAVTTGSLIVGMSYLAKSKPYLVSSAFSSAFGSFKPVNTISWWGEVWPMQWKIAISWISGYFIFQLFTPVLFKYQGSIVAGQMGMTLSVWSAILSICTMWISIKAPLYGNLIVQGKWIKLDNEFNNSLKKTIGITILICTVALITIYYIQLQTPYGERLIPAQFISYLFIALFDQVIINGFSVYLRAHKRDPFVWLSIVGAVFQGTCVFIIGKSFSYEGITIGFAIINTILLFTAYIIWKKCKKKWHYYC
jgi:O-antigen/teichoic acid export membrane protein